MSKKTENVSIPTELAWHVVNFYYTKDFSFAKWGPDEFDLYVEVFDPLFGADITYGHPEYKESDSFLQNALYVYLRPEIIYQHPIILLYPFPFLVTHLMGETLDLSRELKCPHHLRK